ncbi:DUF4352 domain-containing protein [Nonomuraea sp. M3C6]|uniref:DUF4352 domain-containing protein n=1 Tax=Nonomuraea marmarensis TaxID=3351344 RepID=A0ABW7APR7_9ACTN
MSYPQQPPGHHPPHGYGYQPPPQKNNLGVILLLAIGLPVLLLGGCGAMFFVLTAETATVTAQEGDSLDLRTEADDDQPKVQLDLSNPPSAAPEQATPPSAAPEQTAAQPQQQAAAKIGDTITLQGRDPGLKVAVTVNQVIPQATPASSLLKPQTGKRYVAVQLTLTNQGQAPYSDAPDNGALLIDGEGQQHRPGIAAVSEGESFGGSATINTGDSRKGMIVFEVPETATLAKLQFALDSGFADQKGEWALG